MNYDRRLQKPELKPQKTRKFRVEVTAKVVYIYDMGVFDVYAADKEEAEKMAEGLADQKTLDQCPIIGAGFAGYLTRAGDGRAAWGRQRTGKT